MSNKLTIINSTIISDKLDIIVNFTDTNEGLLKIYIKQPKKEDNTPIDAIITLESTNGTVLKQQGDYYLVPKGLDIQLNAKPNSLDGFEFAYIIEGQDLDNFLLSNSRFVDINLVDYNFDDTLTYNSEGITLLPIFALSSINPKFESIVPNLKQTLENSIKNISPTYHVEKTFDKVVNYENLVTQEDEKYIYLGHRIKRGSYSDEVIPSNAMRIKAGMYLDKEKGDSHIEVIYERVPQNDEVKNGRAENYSGNLIINLNTSDDGVYKVGTVTGNIYFKVYDFESQLLILSDNVEFFIGDNPYTATKLDLNYNGDVTHLSCSGKSIKFRAQEDVKIYFITERGIIHVIDDSTPNIQIN